MSSEERQGPEIAGPTTGAQKDEDLFRFLAERGIRQETAYHRAIFTVDEGRDLKADLPGGHTKNLFMKDKKGAMYLAIAHCDTRADLVALGKALGAKGRLSFGSAQLLGETLGVMPGAVTPFTLINSSARALAGVILDTALMDFDRIWFHPLRNDASTAITPHDLKHFIDACGFSPLIVDLAAPELP